MPINTINLDAILDAHPDAGAAIDELNALRETVHHLTTHLVAVKLQTDVSFAALAGIAKSSLPGPGVDD